MAPYLDISLPYGLVPTEATIDGYMLDHSVQALRRVYSVEATFGCESRCFPRYETGGEPSPAWVACSRQLSPHWHEASGSENTEKNTSQRCPIPVAHAQWHSLSIVFF